MRIGFLPHDGKVSKAKLAFTIRHGTIAVPVSPGSELFLPRFMLTVTNAKSLMSELAGTAGH